jgi:hypothetical protein
MYFPQFLVGMTATLLAVMGWTFASTGSVWVSLGWTFLAAVVLQAGYFVAVLWLVRGESRVSDESKATDAPAKLPGPFKRDGILHALVALLFPKLMP